MSSQIDSLFKCYMCEGDVLEKIRSCTRCGQVVCLVCEMGSKSPWQSEDLICPYCFDGRIRPNRLCEKIVPELLSGRTFDCSNEDCKETGMLCQDYISHRRHCVKRLVLCPQKQCKYNTKLRNPTHMDTLYKLHCKATHRLNQEWERDSCCYLVSGDSLNNTACFSIKVPRIKEMFKASDSYSKKFKPIFFDSDITRHAGIYMTIERTCYKDGEWFFKFYSYLPTEKEAEKYQIFYTLFRGAKTDKREKFLANAGPGIITYRFMSDDWTGEMSPWSPYYKSSTVQTPKPEYRRHAEKSPSLFRSFPQWDQPHCKIIGNIRDSHLDDLKSRDCLFRMNVKIIKL